MIYQDYLKAFLLANGWHREAKCVESFEAGFNAGSNAGSKSSDDPEMDDTDFAHPAYIRGEDATVKRFCKIVNDILDGTKANVGTASGPWQLLRQRLYDIRTLLGIAERIVTYARNDGIACASTAQWFKIRSNYAKRLKLVAEENNTRLMSGYCGKCGDSNPECKCPPKENTK